MRKSSKIGHEKTMTGEELRARRKALRMTQQEIAPLLGATYRAVRSWETGARNIPASVPMLFELQTALGGGGVIGYRAARDIGDGELLTPDDVAPQEIETADS